MSGSSTASSICCTNAVFRCKAGERGGLRRHNRTEYSAAADKNHADDRRCRTAGGTDRGGRAGERDAHAQVDRVTSGAGGTGGWQGPARSGRAGHEAMSRNT